ncbi:MAG: hypothetical protein Fur0028_02260 [Bacteroidales bacterium]
MLFINIQQAYSQQKPYSKLQIYFFTQEDNTLLTANEDGTKNMAFQVKGLKDDDEASQFISTLKLYKGIIDIRISKPLSNEFRQVTALCHRGYTLNNVNVVFGEVFNINEVFVNGQKIEINKLEQTYQ